MSESSLPPPPGNPKGRRRATKTAWVFRTPPEDATEQIFFLLERMGHVLSGSLMADLAMFHAAARNARLDPWAFRAVKQSGRDVINGARFVSVMARQILAELEGCPAKPPSPRRRLREAQGRSGRGRVAPPTARRARWGNAVSETSLTFSTSRTQRPRERRLLRDWAGPFFAWCSVVRNLSLNTLRTYEFGVMEFLAFAAEHQLLFPDQVSPGAIEAFLASLRQQRGCSVSTSNARRSCLITFFRFLEREGAVQRNPAKLASSGRGNRVGCRVAEVRNEQYLVLDTLGRRARTPHAARDFALIASMSLTGLRVAETVAVRLHDLDLHQGTLKVEQGNGKRDRVVPVIPWLSVVLERYLTDIRPEATRATSPDALFLQARGGQACTSKGLWRLIHAVVSPIIGARAIRTCCAIHSPAGP